MVSMIILNYNDWELTRKYSLNISSMNIIDHIVIVDNCSPDGSFERLQSIKSEKIEIIKTNTNGGYAQGNNYGINYVVDRYGNDGIVIISNPDIEIEEQSILELVNTLNNDENLFAVTGLVYNLNESLIPIFTWNLPTVPMLFVNSCTLLRNLLFKCFGYGTRVNVSDYDFNQSVIYCDALPGCFFAAKVNKWLELGGFCEKTFLFYEEDILFSKSKRKGMKVALVPASKIIHLEGVSIKKSLNSRIKREMLLQKSCTIYMKEILNANRFIISLYRIWNVFWVPERFFFFQLRNILK